MKCLLSSRGIFFIVFIICAVVLSTAFYLEYFENMLPCVLCWVQRGLFALTGVICLIACLHNPQTTGRRIYALLAFIFSSLGIVAAARQVWLLWNPTASGCLPTTIEDIFTNNPLFEAIIAAFKGTPECGLPNPFLGIDMPYWGVLTFIVLTVILLFQFFRRNSNH